MKKLILSITSAYILCMSVAYSIEAAAAGAVAGLMPLIKPIAEKTLLSFIDHAKEVMKGTKCPELLPVPCMALKSKGCESNHVLSTCKKLCQKKLNDEGYTVKIRFGGDWSLLECVEEGVERKVAEAVKRNIDEAVKVKVAQGVRRKDALENERQFAASDGGKLVEEHERKVIRRGKGKKTEIAVYSQKTLNDVLELLAYRSVARRVVDTGGVILGDLTGVSEKSAKKLARKGPTRAQEEKDTLAAARVQAVADASDLIKTIDNAIIKNLSDGVYGPQ